MHQAVTSSKMHHFSDDTNLLFSNKSPKLMEKIWNQELKSVFEWLCSNRLSINVTKTEFIIFKPPKKQINQRIVLKLNGKKIFESPKIKYLGVILDPLLRWNHHIKELAKKKSCDWHDIQNTVQSHQKLATFTVLQPFPLTPFLWFICMGYE